jgi:hypothetical protein
MQPCGKGRPEKRLAGVQAKVKKLVAIPRIRPQAAIHEGSILPRPPIQEISYGIVDGIGGISRRGSDTRSNIRYRGPGRLGAGLSAQGANKKRHDGDGVEDGHRAEGNQRRLWQSPSLPPAANPG